MRISDWSSDVCSSDLDNVVCDGAGRGREVPAGGPGLQHLEAALGCPGEMIAMMKGGVTTTFPRIPAVVQVRGSSQYPTEVAVVHPQITPPVISRRLAPRTVTDRQTVGEGKSV